MSRLGRGRPARIALGDPLPGDTEILPHSDRLARCCSVAALRQGINTSSPPFNEDDPADFPAFAEVAIGCSTA